MIKKELKKIVARVLTAAMVLSLAPTATGGITAYADENPPEHEKWEHPEYSIGTVDEKVFAECTEKQKEAGGLFKSKVPITAGVQQSSSFERIPISDSDRDDENKFIYRYDATGWDAYDATQYREPYLWPGKVFYDKETNTITATKNPLYVYYMNTLKTAYAQAGVTINVDTNVNLVIQGNEQAHITCTYPGCDWQGRDDKNDYYISISLDDTYYCKVQLDESKKQYVDSCKIWIESSVPACLFGEIDYSKYYAYAVMATEHTHTYNNKLYYAAEKFTEQEEYKGKHVPLCDGYVDGTADKMTCPSYISGLLEQVEAKKLIDHNFKAVYKNENYHYWLCSECEGYDASNTIKGYIKGYDYIATDETTDRWANVVLDSHEAEEKCVTTPSDAATYHYSRCKDCGYLYNKTVHNFEWHYTDSEHYKKCKDCDYIDEATRGDHHFSDSTKCDDGCGYDAAVEHKWKTVPRQEPTCEEVGYEEHQECTDDPNYDVMLTSPSLGVVKVITDISEIEIPANGHDEGKVYSCNSSTHWHTCTVCNKKIDASEAAHTFDKNNVCTVCGYKKTSSSSGGSSSVKTGWIKDSKGWKYRNSDGILAQGTTVTDKDGNKVEKVLWQKAGNGYYAFGSDGYLKTGWIYDKLEDKWYYCDENMGKLYGWFNESQDGYWYYLSPSTGEALTGWHSINGKDYYFAAEPSAPTYSFDASTGFWIYSNIEGNRPFGSMYANTVTPDNYTVDASGAWVR